ncbi:hypothetical protein PHYSODRAFT_305242 [Phytophthora sojae]|uniref:Uncharacterized protein n=1 Tax=Phytophthora sojae (strain P6497) TaxID=1094619 RepID=G5A2H6_PHYSP|nr:hypothetical protein PHYSODRAFT_305242 [Phytophthora sojae]EGZ09867.1 hypothetical protein PHYSODRAFT_305242 [Phytophthora sojae]|eukprot:XP_009534728.1 hypothetical protein PHYSODRAFT_305242 [Phytophthora sojae]
MERKRYFRLVDGARRPQPELGDVPVRYVRVRDGTDAGDFCETVLARCTDSLPPGLIDEAVLKVFVNSEAAGPLNADDALSAYGLNREDPLVVEVPKVWFHLTDAGTQPPFARTSAASVPLTANHTIEKRSRVTSSFEDRTPWCVVVPSLPAFVLNEDGVAITSDSVGTRRTGTIPAGLFWIVKHSRPLFAREVWEYMSRHRDYGETPEDWLHYLSDMTKYLAPHIRSLKARIRSVESELGQVSMFLGSTCSVDNSYANLVDGHFACLSESKPFELDLGSGDILFQGDNQWTARCQLPPPERDILLHLTLMGDHDKIFDDSGEDEEGDGMLRPLKCSLYHSLQDNFFRGTDLRGRLLYELGVVDKIDAEVDIPSNHAKNTSTIPFLSAPNTEWPSSFLDAWRGSGAQFANLCRVADSERIDFRFVSSECGLSGECKDRKGSLDVRTLISVLDRVPSSSSIHLVVVRKLHDTYFGNLGDPAVPSNALVSANLQYADFFRISKEDGELVEFVELMAAKSTTIISDKEKSEKGGGKLILFIEIGDWDKAE